MTRAAPIVIGGGPAGAAAAIHLLRTGAHPIVYERQATTGDALCGGFLSWKTLERLEALGVSREELGGHTVTRLRLCAGRAVRSIPLPAPAMAVSRQRLDRLLLDRAREMGADVRHGTVRFEGGAFRLPGGEALAGESVFLATGKHDMRGLPRMRETAGADPFIGLRARLPASQALNGLLAGHIEMHLFAGGYMGIVLQEDGSANACMAVCKSRLAAAEGNPANLFAQLCQGNDHLAARLDAMPADAAIDAVGRVPYGWCAAPGPAGLFRLGDQAAVIPSLAGEGIGVALASAEMAVRNWHEHGADGAPRFQRQFAARLRPRLALAGLLAGLGMNVTAARWMSRALRIPGIAPLVAQATRL